MSQVHIYQAGLIEIDDEAVEKLSYKTYILHHDKVEKMPLKWYECQPVMSKKIVVMHVESRS